MDIIVITKAIINTLVRLMPIGLYTGSAMNAVVMNDFRGVILFMGFIFNELISLGYRMFIKGAYNPHCALLMTNQGSPFVLPSPITQTVGFFFAFFMMDMYYQDQFLPLRFFVFLTVFILTIYFLRTIVSAQLPVPYIHKAAVTHKYTCAHINHTGTCVCACITRGFRVRH